MPMTNIAICIATYKRPGGLQRLLTSIDNLIYTDGSIEIFIADNDGEMHEGLDYVNANRAHHKYRISCEVEPRPGISFSRNKCISMASHAHATFQYLAFTDDDITVCQNWLADLVRAAGLYQADTVFGKREPYFEVATSARILTSCYFKEEFRCPTTGTEVLEGPTCNMLVAASVFDKLGDNPFDSNLSLSGGEDIDFCIQMKLRGFHFVACASAICYEHFPQGRLNDNWITNRYFRTGSTYAYMLKKHKPGGVFYASVLKKILVLTKSYVVFLIYRNLSTKCKVYNTLGFFYFVKYGNSFQEYGRKVKL